MSTENRRKNLTKKEQTNNEALKTKNKRKYYVQNRLNISQTDTHIFTCIHRPNPIQSDPIWNSENKKIKKWLFVSLLKLKCYIFLLLLIFHFVFWLDLCAFCCCCHCCCCWNKIIVLESKIVILPASFEYFFSFFFFLRPRSTPRSWKSYANPKTAQPIARIHQFRNEKETERIKNQKKIRMNKINQKGNTHHSPLTSHIVVLTVRKKLWYSFHSRSCILELLLLFAVAGVFSVCLCFR